MKNFKLIKWYPSLPKDWEVGMEVGVGDRCSPTSYSPCSLKYKDYYVPCGEVVNNPEYWEEVVDKDYQILTVKHPSGGVLMHPPQNAEGLLKTCQIIAVKRLSDGQVFKVGDKVLHKNQVRNRVAFIENFYLMSNGIWFKCNNYDVPMILIQNNISSHLFKTHDGVDIFEGDSWWYVKLNNFTKTQTDTLAYNGNPKNKVEVLRFSTEQAADEYILMNKPCLSIKECINFKGSKDSNFLKFHLKEIVKSKL